MTMVVAFHSRRVGVIALDTRPRITGPDGSVRFGSFRDVRQALFQPFLGGFATGGGTLSTVAAGLEVVRGARPAPTRQHADRIRRAMCEHTLRGSWLGVYSTPAGPTVNAGWAEVAVLNAGPRGLELGFVRTDHEEFFPIAFGSLYLALPGDTSLAAARPATQGLKAAVSAVLEDRSSRQECVRAVARFFAEIGRTDQHLSGGVIMGFVVRPPGSAFFEGSWLWHDSAAALAAATDQQIQEAVRC